MIIRLSRGRYAPERHAEVSARLAASAATLVPAIRALPGCIAYHAGSDAGGGGVAGSMVNVSVWDSLEHAQAMGSLPEMLALAGEFVAMGVEFERPIVNYEQLWQVAGA